MVLAFNRPEAIVYSQCRRAWGIIYLNTSRVGDLALNDSPPRSPQLRLQKQFCNPPRNYPNSGDLPSV